MEIVERELPEAVFIGDTQRLSRQMRMLYTDRGIPKLSYDFTRKSDSRIADKIGNDKGLYVPTFFTILKKNILLLPTTNLKWANHTIRDYLVNLFGFIPFGFFVHCSCVLRGSTSESSLR